MQKRFIILTDLSEHAEDLLTYAADRAWGRDIELLLVHRTTVAAPAFTDIEIKREMAQQANADARKALIELARERIPADVKVSFSVSEQALPQRIAHLLADPFHQLVFVGMKGTGLLKKLVVGSTALQVINAIDHCVVAVPRDLRTFAQSTLHVSVSDKYPLNIPALNHYLRFLEGRDLRITFFHLASPGERSAGMLEMVKELAASFADRYRTDHAVFEGEDPFDDIKRVVRDRTDEVLVVQRGSRLLTDQVFRRFLIDELVYEGHIPLVVLP